jgi:hypothetical protein
MLEHRATVCPCWDTDKLQPLDRVVFGALKSRARRLIRCRVKTDRGVPRTKIEAVEDMIQAWEELTEDVVPEGWDFDEEWEVKSLLTRSVPCHGSIPSIAGPDISD